MRIIAPTFAAISVLAVGFATCGAFPAQAQSEAVKSEPTPAQSDQARAQDRSRAEDVKIERDWKAHDGASTVGAVSDKDQSHETVGRDWRAHSDGKDN